MEKVNHPAHYNMPGKKECIVQMREDYGDYITAVFCITSAYKYIYRAGNKPGELESDDMKKAKWYYNYILDELEIDWETVDTDFGNLFLYVKEALYANG